MKLIIKQKIEQDLARALIVLEISARFFISSCSRHVLQRLLTEKQWQAAIRELKIFNNRRKLPIQSNVRFLRSIKIADQETSDSLRESCGNGAIILNRLLGECGSIHRAFIKDFEEESFRNLVLEVLVHRLPVGPSVLAHHDYVTAILESDVVDDSEGLNPVNAISKPLLQGEDVSMMWDAGSCYTILKNKVHICNMQPYHQTVVGLAGKRQITHRGEAHSAFGLTHPAAVYISNSGGLPNIMSVSQ